MFTTFGYRNTKRYLKMSNENGTTSIKIKTETYNKLKKVADKSGYSYGGFADVAIEEKIRMEKKKKLKLEKEVAIDGCVTIPKSVSESEFWSEFISWVESNGYKFGGGVKEV